MCVLYIAVLAVWSVMFPRKWCNKGSTNVYLNRLPLNGGTTLALCTEMSMSDEPNKI